MAFDDGIARILVVEDERIVAMGLQSQLESLGYAVPALAVTGEEAVRLAEAMRPDLMLMDIRLDGGGIDGVEAAGRIRRLGIPVVYLTAYSNNGYFERAKRTEPFGYILKPYDERALHVVVETALYKHRMEGERRRMEDLLCQAQKMQAVGRLAGGVAHELNNVLHVVLGYSTMLLGSVLKGEPIYEGLSEIKNQAGRASRLTEQLLAFGRRQMLAPVSLDLNGVVSGMEKALRPLLGAGIHLSTRLALGLRPVMADPTQIREALMNLASNARDAMPGGGRFTIQTANADPDDQALHTNPEAIASAYVVVALSDTGRGMDRETQQRCLEPFFTTKEFGQGSGLGLSTVDGIIHQSGGFITLSSEPGRGTTFTIYLPAVEQADPSQQADPSDSTTSSGSATA